MPARGNDLFCPTGNVRPDCFTVRSLRALQEALLHARLTHWESVRTPHLFMGLLTLPDAAVRDWCARLPVDPQDLLLQFETSFHSHRPDPPAALRLHREFLSDNALAVLRDARLRCVEAGREQVTPMDLLVSILAASAGIVAECVRRLGFAPDRLLELAVLAGARRHSR